MTNTTETNDRNGIISKITAEIMMLQSILKMEILFLIMFVEQIVILLTQKAFQIYMVRVQEKALIMSMIHQLHIVLLRIT